MNLFGRGAAALALSVGVLGGALAQVPIGPPPPPVAPHGPVVAPAKHLIGPAGVAAVVNGQPITKTQVMDLAYQLGGPDVLERLINNTLVEQEAKKENIVVTPAEIDQRIAQIRQQLAQSPQHVTLEALLAQSHETLTNFRESQRLYLDADKMVVKSLPPVNMVHVRHLLVLTGNPANSPMLKPHTDAEAQAIIAKAQADLKSGMTFDAVAKKYSEDPSNKDKGGDLGLLGPQGLYNTTLPGQTFTPVDPTFQAAALALHKGEVTPTAVKSVFGYHLIQAVSTSASPLDAQEKASYAAAISAAQQSQLQQAIPPFLQNLRQKAKISNYLAP